MEKSNTMFFVYVILIFLTACSGDNENEQLKAALNNCQQLKAALNNCQNENQQIKNQRAQVISELEEKNFTNTKLIKDIANADIRATGITLTTAMVSMVALFINNLIWFIAYRKKK